MSYTYVHNAKYKNNHNPALWLIVFSGAFGVVLAGVLASGFRLQSSPPPTLRATSQVPVSVPTASINYGLPVRIQIPKLQVDAPVRYMGVTKTGSMSVPGNIVDTGWYKYSALPGNSGTAVIAGHVDGLRGEAGVFSSLDKVVAGDTITVTGSNGSATSFVVHETKSYNQNDQPKEVFASTSGSHLNLITCTGSWDSSKHQFAKRLVVFADKIS